MFKNMLLCSVALLCSSIQCGKHKRVKKEQYSGVHEEKVICRPHTTLNAFREILAKKMNVDIGQIGIIFGEKNISFQGESTLQDLMISTKSKPSVVINAGVAKPHKRSRVQRKNVPASKAAIKTDVQKNIDEFLND